MVKICSIHKILESSDHNIINTVSYFDRIHEFSNRLVFMFLLEIYISGNIENSQGLDIYVSKHEENSLI